MAILTLYGIILFVVYTAPAVLLLWPFTYDFIPAAHFLVFLASVVLFALAGRSLAQKHVARFVPAFVTGVVVAFLGTAATQYIGHLPMAEDAFVQQLHGVPREAALTMLNLHVISGTIISGIMYGVLYGFLGGFAAWWGGRGSAPAPSEPGGHAKNDDQDRVG